MLIVSVLLNFIIKHSEPSLYAKFTMSRKIDWISTEKLAEPIRKLAVELGCTQEDLAHRVGAKWSTFQKWLSGTRPHNDAVRAFRRLAPNESIRDLFPDPDDGKPKSWFHPGMSIEEEWAHMAVETIFDRAPKTVQEKTMEFLESAAGKPWLRGNPSPRQPVPQHAIKAKR